MESTPPPTPAPPTVVSRTSARAGLLLVAGVLATAGCGSTPATGAGGGAPGPAHSIGDTPLPVVPTPAPPPVAGIDPGTVGPVPRPGAGTTPTAAPVGTCSPEGVALTVGEADAAMGLRVMPVRLSNCGTRPYSLNGHPAVRVLDAERAPLAVTVKRGSAGIATLANFDAAPKPLTLQPREYAEFQLVWRNTVAAVNKAPDNGRYLDVAPLPGRPRLTVPADLDLGTTGRLGVAPWFK
ncbi:DUF4232 domain-containing protein [Kitasatospora purpeofusca]|uniref:DUF4232 domain-containing protein n=1 Tax=Kitasatospora purpeofusca TaxID=67352 RepID=A0ABZ1U9X6_9ACTN|nr:DUF4232 domain-containing protein [Kitasatospora purpeofusca]